MAVQELRKRSVQAAIRDFVDRSTTSIQKILTRTAHIAYTDFDEVFSWDERGNLHVIPSADLSPAAKALVGGIIQKRTIHRNRDGGEIEEVQTSGLQSVADRVGSTNGRRAATAARSLGVSAT